MIEIEEDATAPENFRLVSAGRLLHQHGDVMWREGGKIGAQVVV
ncbi:hypothetical protein [Methylobacterium sp. J-070]|nr:hypothetical protein [Methylobacterium sp. J-070]